MKAPKKKVTIRLQIHRKKNKKEKCPGKWLHIPGHLLMLKLLMIFPYKDKLMKSNIRQPIV